MNSICSHQVQTPDPPAIPKRNGMDPPTNYTNVRDWQMSPFGNARYDLDELQRAEKRGFKGRFEYERLKKLYCEGEVSEPPKNTCTEHCLHCPEKKKKRKYKKCATEYLYQPYGPTVVSSLSYSRPETNKPRLYSYLGPSFYSGYRFKVPAPETMPIIPCADLQRYPQRNFDRIYTPYGPYGELRFTPEMYTPMGPSVLPVI